MGPRRQRQKYLPGLARGEFDRLFRPDRARRGLRSGGHERPVAKQDRRRLCPERFQDVDLELAHSRCLSWSGPSRRPHEGKIRGFVLEKGMNGAFPRRRSAGNSRSCASVTGEIVMDGVEVGETRSCPGGGAEGTVRLPQTAHATGIRLGRDGPRRRIAGTGRVNTGWTGCSSAARWRRRSFSRRSSPTCRPRSLWGFRRRCARGGCWTKGSCAPEVISLIKTQQLRQGTGISRGAARDMHGGNGIMAEVPCDAAMPRTSEEGGGGGGGGRVNTYEGTHDVHALILGPRAGRVCRRSF